MILDEIPTGPSKAGRMFAYGHTHEKNPVTTRAALTTVEIVEDEQLVDNADRIGRFALRRLAEMKDRHPLIGDIRGRGCLLGIELVLTLTPPLIVTNEQMLEALGIIDRGLTETEAKL